jgi:two-component system, cell cycle response regulator DivK
MRENFMPEKSLFFAMRDDGYQLLKCRALEHQHAMVAGCLFGTPALREVLGKIEGQAAMTLEAVMQNGNPHEALQKRVLIVEDNELNMKLFNDLLEAHGYGTLQTKDGMEALRMARQHHPDLILMDIQLPEVSGLEVIKWLKEDDNLAAIPVIAVTAFAMKGDEEKIRNGGCEAYIAKPISVASFMRAVERFLS